MITIDIPQANALEKVRRVVKVIALGAKTPEAVAAFAQYSTRHANYRIHAARILGLIRNEGEDLRLTHLGEKLLQTEPFGVPERQLFFKSIESCAVIQAVCPDLLTLCPPTKTELTQRLFEASKLSRETAERRASGLLAWRRYVLNEPRSKAPADPSPKGETLVPNVKPFGEQLSLF